MPPLLPTAGAINYTYHRFGKQDSDKPPLVLIQGLGTTQYGWPLAVSAACPAAAAACCPAAWPGALGRLGSSRSATVPAH